MKEINSKDVWVLNKSNYPDLYNSYEYLLMFNNYVESSSNYDGYANRNYRHEIILLGNKCTLINKQRFNLQVPLDFKNYGDSDEVYYFSHGYNNQEYIIQMCINYKLDYIGISVYKKVIDHSFLKYIFVEECFLQNYDDIKAVFEKGLQSYKITFLVKKLFTQIMY